MAVIMTVTNLPPLHGQPLPSAHTWRRRDTHDHELIESQKQAMTARDWWRSVLPFWTSGSQPPWQGQAGARAGRTHKDNKLAPPVAESGTRRHCKGRMCGRTNDTIGCRSASRPVRTWQFSFRRPTGPIRTSDDRGDKDRADEHSETRLPPSETKSDKGRDGSPRSLVRGQTHKRHSQTTKCWPGSGQRPSVVCLWYTHGVHQVRYPVLQRVSCGLVVRRSDVQVKKVHPVQVRCSAGDGSMSVFQIASATRFVLL